MHMSAASAVKTNHYIVLGSFMSGRLKYYRLKVLHAICLFKCIKESLKIQIKKENYCSIFEKGKNVILEVQIQPFVALRLESLDTIFGKTSSTSVT